MLIELGLDEASKMRAKDASLVASFLRIVVANGRILAQRHT